MRVSDYGIIIALVGIVVMMVIPLPTGLLSIMLILNISLALLILLISIQTTEPLQFSIFPSVLLIATLFRLALNVSTTRSILSEGYAGKVVETFGEFVVGGNAVVGFIVFLILVIVQFLVITKGSERVAEVAARFTLDAMPGKQMSIDADLNAGIITETDAKNRREKIQNEADFYGAMDGASKFVKGDAIAGIVIVLVNIIGGFIIGMVQLNLTFTDAMSRFTLLSVGDGLVSQIPALLISTATGLIVTRAATGSNLGQDFANQVFSYPRLFYVVAVVILLMGLATPIGMLLTLPIAAVIAYSGYRLQLESNKEETIVEDQETESSTEDIRSPESVLDLLQVDPIEFEFGYGLIPIADTNQGGDLLDRVIMIRRQIALEMGLVVPVIRIRDNIQLKPNEYVVKIKGNEVATGELLLDHYLAMSPGIDDEDIHGIETMEPAFGLPALWISEDMKEKAELSGYTVVDAPSVVATHLTEVIKKHAHELLGRQETKALVDKVKENYPAVVDELVPQVMTVGDIQKVLANLLREKVSIRNLSTIFECLADYGQTVRDPNLLTEYVRAYLKRQITNQFKDGNEPLRVLTMSPEIENIVAENIHQDDQNSYLAVNPEVSQQIYHAIHKQVARLVEMGQAPILLVAPNIRYHLKRLIEPVLPDVIVLSYNELESSVEVQSVGMVELS
ncbi:flagellar biosynthesis protein FlhA [Desulfuribacillus stibiiarsenatis]|uniref:Flagellar biosynthesis protein FlhA n=1 Tax=Desulfuribacillus stibiiarsenatis TaxID=1390249 RepID=A0A1E5L6T6_9FIRM|nr:flagellar biosynthesis protein FlhA [Desulfuribacillus stibiiarsenatis]OEH85836.1 flagellar biosynthesis protein FlhA [Desulfuribacillus stibiiarsenatis]